MKRYLPNRTEASMLIIGIFIGSLLMFSYSSWAIIFVIAPVILVAELVTYVYGKRKANFEKDLNKSNNYKELIKNE
jgi:uncharacterized membrane protein YoaK (UPF0700 family)